MLIWIQDSGAYDYSALAGLIRAIGLSKLLIQKRFNHAIQTASGPFSLVRFIGIDRTGSYSKIRNQEEIVFGNANHFAVEQVKSYSSEEPSLTNGRSGI